MNFLQWFHFAGCQSADVSVLMMFLHRLTGLNSDINRKRNVVKYFYSD